MNKKTTLLIIVVCALALGIGVYTVFSRPAPVAPTALPSTSSEPETGVTTTTVTTTSASPSNTSSSSSPTMVTPANNGQTLVFTEGDRFGIAFGDTLQWSLAFDPLGVVTRVTNISTLRGEQGVYTATSVGTTTLSAIGAPICNPGEACPQFRQSVTVTLVVKDPTTTK